MSDLRVAVLGLIHDHVWDHLPQLTTTPGVALAAVAEPDDALRQRAVDKYGCPAYRDAELLLMQERPDAVFVFSSNALGAELATSALEQGADVMIEKPMSATLEEAEYMLATARQFQRRLMINWPFAWWPQLQYALRLAVTGRIGEIWQIKYRAAHAGPVELGCSDAFCGWLFDREQNGGGALVDYCCYGAVLASAVLGLPHRVYGLARRLRRQELLVDDNGLLVMTYPKAIATAEGSWTQIGKLTSYTTAIYGTTGTLLVEPRRDGRLWLATEDAPEGQVIEVPPLPDDLMSATAHFAYCRQHGEPFLPLCQDAVCRDAQEILEAGRLSAESGAEINLPLRT